jgi:hypothetical protein
VADDVDDDLVPGVGPVGVVIEPLSSLGDPDHEREGLGEVLEGQLTVELAVDHLPAGVVREAGLDVGRRERCVGHDSFVPPIASRACASD